MVPSEAQSTIAILHGSAGGTSSNFFTYVARGDLALSLPFGSRLKSTISWTGRRQDDDLLPPTVNSASIFGFDLADWSTPAAPSQSGADAKIDTWLLDTAFESRPWRPLRLKARFRYYDLSNDTDYDAFNPVTSEFGYIVEDGGNASIFGPSLLA